MNPLTNMRKVNELNDRELKSGHAGTKLSWHNDYKDSAWIFVGGLPFDLTEGDIICVFSQYGEIANINLVRDKDTGKSKGFAFICYEDQRSSVLAVDNFNGVTLCGRIIRVDHVKDYKVPDLTKRKNVDAVTAAIVEHGCAPEVMPNIEAAHETAKMQREQEEAESKEAKSGRGDRDDRRKERHRYRRHDRSGSRETKRHHRRKRSD